jgi:hypothetical protein
MPHLLWKDGVTSLTDLSAKMKVGIIFTLAVVSLQEEGSKFFTLVLGSSQRFIEMHAPSISNVAFVLGLVEMRFLLEAGEQGR